MGKSKEKQKNNASILLENPFCCFCGQKAVTVDHRPPRFFFVKRQWPDSYAFSCCKSCNNVTRDDEQILAVLTRISISKDRSDVEVIELNNLLTGVRNNKPEVLQEWSNMSPTRLKRFYRESFGNSGDKLRHSGLSALNIGQVATYALNRFIAKIAKALYYKHVGYRCDGTITFGMIDVITYNIKETT